MLSELLISILSAFGRLGSVRDRNETEHEVDSMDRVERPEDMTAIFAGGHCP
jgi:hypothetical protein